MPLLQRKIPATVVIIAINVLVFLLVGTSKHESLQHFFKFHNHFPFFGFGITWITSHFYHQELSHIFWNLFFLFFAGITIEKRLGTEGLWCLVLGASIVSHLGTMLGYDNSVGAFGASAVALAFIVYCLLTHKTICLWGQGDDALTISSWWLLIYFTYSDFLTVLFPSVFVEPEIDRWGHMGGALVGFLFWVFYDPYTDYRFVSRWWKEAALTMAFIAISFHIIELKHFGGLGAYKKLFHFHSSTLTDYGSIISLKAIRSAILTQKEPLIESIAVELCVPLERRGPNVARVKGVDEVRQLASVIGVSEEHPGFQLLLKLIQDPKIQTEADKIEWVDRY